MQEEPWYNPIVVFLSGMSVPLGSAQRMYDEVQVPHEEVVRGLEAFQNEIVAVANGTSSGASGAWPQEYVRAMGTFASGDGADYVQGLKDAAGQLADGAHEFGYQIDYTNAMIVGQVVVFLAEWALTLVLAYFNPIQALVEQLALERVFGQFFKMALVRFAINAALIMSVSVGLAAALDGLVRWVLALKGETTTQGAQYRRQSLEFGAVQGAFGAFLPFLMEPVAKLVSKAFGPAVSNAIRDAVDAAVTDPGKELAGAAGKDFEGGAVRAADEKPAPPPLSVFSRHFADEAAQMAGALHAGVVDLEARRAFATGMGKLFAQTFGEAGRAAGQDWALAFAKNLGRPALQKALYNSLEKLPAETAGEPLRTALSRGVVRGLDTQAWKTKFAHIPAEAPLNAAHQNISEGFFNWLTTGQFTTSFATGISGAGGGIISAVMHLHAVHLANWLKPDSLGTPPHLDTNPTDINPTDINPTDINPTDFDKGTPTSTTSTSGAGTGPFAGAGPHQPRPGNTEKRSDSTETPLNPQPQARGTGQEPGMTPWTTERLHTTSRELDDSPVATSPAAAAGPSPAGNTLPTASSGPHTTTPAAPANTQPPQTTPGRTPAPAPDPTGNQGALPPTPKTFTDPSAVRTAPAAPPAAAIVPTNETAHVQANGHESGTHVSGEGLSHSAGSSQESPLATPAGDDDGPAAGTAPRDPDSAPVPPRPRVRESVQGQTPQDALLTPAPEQPVSLADRTVGILAGNEGNGGTGGERRPSSPSPVHSLPSNGSTPDPEEGPATSSGPSEQTPPELARLRNEVNLHLGRRGDTRVASTEQVANAYGKLPSDLRSAHPKRMADGIADILQRDGVVRGRGGGPTLTSESVPGSGTGSVEQMPTAGPSGTTGDKGKGRDTQVSQVPAGMSPALAELLADGGVGAGDAAHREESFSRALDEAGVTEPVMREAMARVVRDELFPPGLVGRIPPRQVDEAVRALSEVIATARIANVEELDVVIGRARDLALLIGNITRPETLEAFGSGGHEQLSYYMSEAADTVMKQAVDAGLALLPAPPRHPFAVLAVGGFGRRDMTPAADLDFGLIGDDTDQTVLNQLRDLVQSHLNLTRGLLEPPRHADAKAPFEPDVLWLNQNGPRGPEVSPQRLLPHLLGDESTMKQGGVHDSRLIDVDLGYDGEQRAEQARLLDAYGRLRLALTDAELERSSLRGHFHNEPPPVRPGRVDVKDSVLRPLTLAVQRLNALREREALERGDIMVEHVTGTGERIDRLVASGRIDRALGMRLKDAFGTAMRIRQQLHRKYGGELDQAWVPGDGSPQSGLQELTAQEVRDLTEAVTAIRDLHSGGKAWLDGRNPDATITALPATRPTQPAASGWGSLFRSGRHAATGRGGRPLGASAVGTRPAGPIPATLDTDAVPDARSETGNQTPPHTQVTNTAPHDHQVVPANLTGTGPHGYEEALRDPGARFATDITAYPMWVGGAASRHAGPQQVLESVFPRDATGRFVRPSRVSSSWFSRIYVPSNHSIGDEGGDSARTAYAVHQTLRGYPMVSGHAPAHLTADTLPRQFGRSGLDYEGTEPRGLGRLADKLRLLGAGSDAILLVSWIPLHHDQEVEHFFNAFYNGQEVVYLDARGQGMATAGVSPFTAGSRVTAVESIVFDPWGNPRDFTPE